MRAKIRHKAKIVEFIGNPEHDFPTREQLAKLCGITPQGLYKNFSVEEFQEMEKEGLELRRKRYAKEAVEVDKGLISRAKDGDPAACKLFYQRFECWSEKLKREHSVEKDSLARLLRELDGKTRLLPKLNR